MLVAIGAFWAGRRRFVHIPPSGRKALDDLLAPESLRALGKLLILYIFIAMFWALFEQSESAWVLQARELNLTWLGIQWLPARLQAVNPVLILVMIPLFTYVVYPAINTVWHLTPLRKIGLGLFLGAVCFCIPALIEVQIAAGHRPSIGWQFLAYFFLTAAEIMISITALEFSYTQAPVKIKSFVSCFYLISISLGNLFTAIVNEVIEDAEGNVMLTGASYYWFFTIAMLVTAILYVPAAKWYPVTEYIQEEQKN
jgi:POT family proton-dependent oligopeptide transporter